MAGGANKFLSTEVMSAMGRLPLMARDVVEGFITGLYTSPFHGFSAEFAEHRKYVPGDSIKDLDWNAYARTDRYYVKRYKEETNLRCRILVDASASMGFASDDISKLEYSARLGACLAYLAYRQRDAVGLTLCNEGGAVDLEPAGKESHLMRVMQMLEDLRASGRPDVAGSIHDAAERMRRRGLVIAISDLLDNEINLVNAMKHLRHRRHEVILFHVLDAAEETLPYRNVSEFIDLESGGKLMVDPQAVRDEYLKQIAAFRARYRKFCSDAGIDYVAVNTAEPVEKMLMHYLVRRARS